MTELDWEPLLKVLRGIAMALNHIHNLPDPVIHGDLKPANVLLDEVSLNISSLTLNKTSRGNISLFHICLAKRTEKCIFFKTEKKKKKNLIQDGYKRDKS